MKKTVYIYPIAAALALYQGIVGTAEDGIGFSEVCFFLSAACFIIGFIAFLIDCKKKKR